MTSPRLPPGIQVRDLTLRFGQQTIFERLSFDIAGGSFVSLLGASGAGKTSLLKIIAGLAQASSGTVSDSDGLPIAGRIAYMGQKDLLYPWLSVEDNVALGSRLRGEAPDRAWTAHLLERVGLAAHSRSLPAELLAQNTVLLITHDPMEACRLSHRLLVLSPWPLGLDDTHRISGQPPRAPDDADLLKSQAELLLQMVRAAQ